MHQNGQLLTTGPNTMPDGMDKLLTAALDSAPVGLIILGPDRAVRLLTGGAALLLDMPYAGAATGLPIRSVLEACPALDRDSLPTLIASLDHQEDSLCEALIAIRAPSGPRMLSVDIRPVGALGWILSLEDVTRTRQTQDWLLEHASSDPVTGLWNRQHFLLMLSDRLATSQACPEGQVQALLLVGLQRVKQVNERLGLPAGDTLLRMVGDRLAALLQEDDMLARFAGDEFAIAVGCEQRADVEAFAEQLCASLARPFVVDGQSLVLGAHVGIACAPDDGDTVDRLVANAGLALVETGTRGAAPLRFFEPALIERAHLRRSLETDLRSALSRHEFELHYQPQVDLHRDCVTGLEALIRWRSPKRGLVPPADFIELAEQIGLINDIGDWVLRQACREAASWPEAVTVAINASPLQFETGHFARTVADALAQTGLPASRLEIEITENLLLRDTGTVMGTLAALHAMGVRLVLDDFGTGYASLSQLSRFRFDKIKIDRSFVSPDRASMENSAIVRSIAALGRSLGIPTTAEGVETARQLEQIRADGCTLVQGYFFSRPVPTADVNGMLHRLHVPAVCFAA